MTIAGPKSTSQLNDLAPASDLRLSADEIATLDQLSAPPVGYPQRVIDVYFDRALAA